MADSKEVTKLKKENHGIKEDLISALKENIELKDIPKAAEFVMSGIGVSEASNDNMLTKLLVFFMGDAGRSKRMRAILVSILTAILSLVASSVDWVDPAWSSGLAGLIIMVVTVYVNGQSRIDEASNGKTSANPPN